MRGEREAAAGQAAGDPRRERGRKGEEIACRYLRRRLYSIIETNFRTRYGEIDIIARRGNTIVFIEVKARRDKSYGEPFESVTPRKQSRIRRMAESWLMAHQHESPYNDCDFRFDVISILLDGSGKPGEFRHIEDAFW